MNAQKAHKNVWKPQVNVLVIGGGITGCAAACELQAQDIDHLLLERNAEPGGLSRSISVGDAHFDYTGHFLHLQRYDTPATIPYANLDDDEWQRVERTSCIYLDGEFVPAPFQYNLYYLPQELRKKCIEDFRRRPIIGSPTSFKEYLLTGFGEEVCRLFLFPYNEKIQAMELDRLSLDSVKRFFPPPDVDKIENGWQAPAQQRQGGSEYNSRFWYPKRGGIGLLPDGLSAGLKSLSLACPVQHIELSSRRAHTSMGIVSYDRMLSSMPLKDLCLITDDDDLKKLAAGLSNTRVASVNLMVKGKLPESLSDVHWVYVPEPKHPFYRVGFYSNIVPDLVPDGYFSMYVETATLSGTQPERMADVVSEMIDGLDRLGWLLTACPLSPPIGLTVRMFTSRTIASSVSPLSPTSWPIMES